MSEFGAELRSLAAGSLPHTDTTSACRLAMEVLDIPTWPQLPRRSFLENMYVQYSERFPGLVIEQERIYVDRDQELDADLEQLYVAYLMNDLEHAAIGADYAAGLHCLTGQDEARRPLLKGQVTGPVSWGLMVTDQDRKPILYDDILAEATGQHLRLKASWMERELRQLSPQTIVFVDEPYMSSYGSAFFSLNHDQVVALLEEVFAGIEGLKGVHCCGNTDWSLLLSTGVDILNLDAYNYAEALALYPDHVGEFLGRGGIIAWGIVPASNQADEETVASLLDRFHAVLELFVNKGLHRDDLLASSMIMPSCGCGTLEVKTAERVFELTDGVAKALQERYR
jgi:hypothetical protein